MIGLGAEEIRKAAGAKLLAGEPASADPDDRPVRAVVDSRDVARGDLFFGLPGERTDGGRFAKQALAAGAWGVVVTEEHAGDAREAGAGRVLAAADPLGALGRVARAWADRLADNGCAIVGITGSTGKTSTKDILLSLLEPPLGAAVRASRGNYNTEVGLPLTVLEAPADTRVLVLEMAMRGSGQISELCRIAPPHVGVITNVGPVHLELLGTVENVARAKAELIAALPGGGACVVPVAAEALRPHLRSDVRTITFAEWPGPDGGPLAGVERVAGAAADVRVIEAKPARVGGRDGVQAEIAVGAERAVLEFGFDQAHNVTNALAAIGTAHVLGLPLAQLAEGARQVRFSSLRGEEIELARDVLVVNDCYNANPISMRAALSHLAELAARRRAARTVAVLGEMAELGPDAARFHRDVGELAARQGVGALVAVGPLAAHYVEGFGDAGEVRRVADAGEAAAVVRELIAPGDVVLVKGSRSVGLERVAEELRAGEAGHVDAEGVRS